MLRTEDPLSNLRQAAALLRSGQTGAARELCEAVLKSQPKLYGALNLLGVILMRAGEPKRALVLFAKAIAVDPASSAAFCNRGVALQELGDLEGALASLDQAIAINAGDAEAHHNRGNVLRALWRLEESLASYERAIAASSGHVEAHTNRGVALAQLGRHEEALRSFDRALALRPDYPPAHWNRGNVALLLGDFARGWEDFEWRWRLGPGGGLHPRYADRLWSGREPLMGKRILLYAEQGLGDTIQFCRYVPQVAGLGAEVFLEAQKPLANLLGALPGVSRLIGAGEEPPAFDYQCPLMSLAHAFGTGLETIPSSAAYLRSDPELKRRWRERLGPAAKPRVGLAWSGRATHPNDHNRSLALEPWLSCLPDGFEYVSLQKEVRESDRRLLQRGSAIRQFTRELDDFAETAALCDCLDVVITVDTSIAHLAGALGKRAWILLPFNPDWRWMLDRRDSPWYPSATLYRQRSMDDWPAVLDQVRSDLMAGPSLTPA